MNPAPSRGVAMVLAAAALWGTTGTAQSFASPNLSSYWVGSLRLVAASIFFLPTIARWRAGPCRPLPWAQVAAAAACVTTYNLAFFAGVRSAGVAVGTTIALGSGPIWAGILQALWLGRLPPARWWAGTAVAIAGVGLMIAGRGAVGLPPPGGASLCLLAGLSYAVYALVNKRMVSAAPAGPVTAAVFFVAAVLAAPVAAALAGRPTPTATDVAVIAWLGVLSTGVAYMLFSHALRAISSATGVALALAEPATAFVLAVVIVGERPGAGGVAGLLAVLAGLGMVIRAELAARQMVAA